MCRLPEAQESNEWGVRTERSRAAPPEHPEVRSSFL